MDNDVLNILKCEKWIYSPQVFIINVINHERWDEIYLIKSFRFSSKRNEKKILIYFYFPHIVYSLHILKQNDNNTITVNRGDEVILLCTADVEALACVFHSPTGQAFPMLKAAK